MEINTGLFFTAVVVALLLGGVVGGVWLSKETIKEVKVPGECEECEACEVCEVVEEVPVESILDLAVATFMQTVDDEEDEAGNDVELLEPDKHEYDFDEVSISKVYDEYTVEYDDDVTKVTFDIKLKYKEDGESSEKETYKVRVIFEEGEDSRVKILQIL